MGSVNWEKIKPRYPTFTPWDTKDQLPQDLLRDIINMGPPTSERYPGYKKGTKSMVGECGIPGPMENIVGGSEATPHSYPWMAALFVDDTWFCGATLISDEWVLTAAHCAHDATEMKVMLGAHGVREETEEGRLELITRDFFTHEKYSQITLHNDLALVHLPEPVNFTDIIRPELREVTVDTITNIACALEYPTVVNKNIICISGKNGKSTCNGDSGGPLHLVQDGVFKQIGITSFGSSLGCEIGMHAGFTRPASFLEWIETNTGIAIEP